MVLEYLLSPSQFPVFSILISVFIVGVLSLALFYVGFVGGADAKAFISIAAVMPLYPKNLIPLGGVTSVFFPLSVLTNSVIFSASSVFFMLLWNLMRKLRGGELFSSGFEKEPHWKKLLTLMTSVRVDLEYLKKFSVKYSLAETLVPLEGGGFERRLKVVYRVKEETVGDELKPYLEGGVEGEVWVTPLLPMMVFITLGILCTLFIGDIVIVVMARIFSLL
jgi:preflagellin peptidase FlaK